MMFAPPPHQNDYVAYLTPSSNSVYFDYATKDGSYATIDWGDGNIEQTTSTSASHAYSSSSDRGTIAIYGNLTYLDISGDYDFNGFDVSNCKNLKKLKMNFTWISNFDVSKNTKLTYLSAGPCHDTSIDLSNNTKLTYLYLYLFDEITTIDLSVLTELDNITLYFCKRLTAVDLSKNKKLTEITLNNLEDLETLDLSGLLNVVSCNLKSVILTYTKLTSIRCANSSSVIYNELIYCLNYDYITSTGTLITDNSTETETLRTTFESKGWTVITE